MLIGKAFKIGENQTLPARNSAGKRTRLYNGEYKVICGSFDDHYDIYTIAPLNTPEEEILRLSYDVNGDDLRRFI